MSFHVFENLKKIQPDPTKTKSEVQEKIISTSFDLEKYKSF